MLPAYLIACAPENPCSLANVCIVIDNFAALIEFIPNVLLSSLFLASKTIDLAANPTYVLINS